MRFILLLLLFPAWLSVSAQKKLTISSPDKLITFQLAIAKGNPVYSVTYKGRTLITPSPLGFVLEEGPVGAGSRFRGPVFSRGTEAYQLAVGKAKSVNHPYNSLSVDLTADGSRSIDVRLVVRVFDDGIGFRYEFQKRPGLDSLHIIDENTSFFLAGNPRLHALLLPGYNSSHEGEYTHVAWSEMKQDTLMDMPALVEYPDSIYMAITEANLLDYAGMYLMKTGDKLISKLSPRHDDPALKVKASLPHATPWRVLLIGDRPGVSLESNLLTSLCAPSRIGDAGWLKPGKTTFPWWNGNVTPDTLNAPGNNFVTQQYYIDFCARNGIEYHSVVEYGLHQWYMDDGVGFQPGPHADVTTPVPGLDMKEVCDYGRSKGVGIRVWVHWAALYPRLDSAFAIFEKWGLQGMMVDFMDRDDQEMVNMQTEMLVKAAKHKLHIQFHGAYKPTGLHRTYPNELTREGTLNYEVNKWDKRITPDHDLDIVFIRMLAGSTDYHMGGFRAVPDSLFKVQYTRPLMMGTRSHMLGMFVVLEDFLQMVCDYPAAYEGEPGFEFVKQTPTTWDETRVLHAKLQDHITIARRKNDEWYVGSINNHVGKAYEIALDFLPPGEYDAVIYSDASDTRVNPNHLVRVERRVNRQTKINIEMAAGGGNAMYLRPVR